MKLSTRQLTLCAVLTAMALALSYLENFFPLSLAIPIPGIKLGLANIVTLFALYALGPGQALLILVARCLLGAVFAGNMNALIFSLMGGVTAMLVMIGLSRLRHLSVYGVSVGGAAAHNCGQVAAAVLTLGNTAPLYYLPVLLGASRKSVVGLTLGLPVDERLEGTLATTAPFRPSFTVMPQRRRARSSAVLSSKSAVFRLKVFSLPSRHTFSVTGAWG